MSICRPPLIFAAALGAVGGTGPGCFPAELRDRHASTVEQYLATPFQAPEAPFLDPNQALGPPDGRTVALGRGAFVTLRFFRPVPDAPGPDLRIYEVGADGARARIAVGDGARFVEAPEPLTGPVDTLDLEALGLESAAFVRIRGLDDAGEEPGFDLDAVEALH